MEQAVWHMMPKNPGGGEGRTAKWESHQHKPVSADKKQSYPCKLRDFSVSKQKQNKMYASVHLSLST